MIEEMHYGPVKIIAGDFEGIEGYYDDDAGDEDLECTCPDNENPMCTCTCEAGVMYAVVVTFDPDTGLYNPDEYLIPYQDLEPTKNPSPSQRA